MRLSLPRPPSNRFPVSEEGLQYWDNFPGLIKGGITLVGASAFDGEGSTVEPKHLYVSVLIEEDSLGVDVDILTWFRKSMDLNHLHGPAAQRV